jgi:drug/metabolite transporter (DMT)-like permease
MTPINSSLKAALWMMGAVGSFTAMAVAARQINHVHDSFEIMLARSGIGFVIVLVVGAAMGQLGSISTARLGGHALRNLVHFTGQNLWFWALGLIPLAQVFALEFTSPIWVILLSPIFLGEKMTRSKVVSAGPGILFWLTVFQFLFGLVAAGFDGQITWPTAQTLPWLILIGAAGVFAHLSLTSALSLAPASYVVPLDFLRLPVIAAVGAYAYSEPLDPYVMIGGAIIFAGIWLNIRAELMRNSKPS